MRPPRLSIPKVSRGPKARHFCFTINNPTMEGTEFLAHIQAATLRNGSPLVEYCIFQKECGASGTVHYQGALKTTNAQRFSSLQKKIATGHWEVMKGKPAQAAAYCMKKDSTYLQGPWSFGKIPRGQGNRADILALYEATKNGATDTELFETLTVPMMKYHKAVDKIRGLHGPARRTKPRQTIVLFGITRTGKTRAAMAYEKEDKHVYVPPAGKGFWMNEYSGQRTVVVEEFDGNWPLNDLKRLLDPWYDCSVPMKGNFIWWKPDKVIITSNTNPDQWYSLRSQTDRDAMMARIDRSIKVRRGGSTSVVWSNDHLCSYKDPDSSPDPIIDLNQFFDQPRAARPVHPFFIDAVQEEEEEPVFVHVPTQYEKDLALLNPNM